jgi:hypothetical protein
MKTDLHETSKMTCAAEFKPPNSGQHHTFTAGSRIIIRAIFKIAWDTDEYSGQDV